MAPEADQSEESNNGYGKAVGESISLLKAV